MATLKLNDVTTMTESGGTVTMADGVALGTPASGVLTNATFPAGHIVGHWQKNTTITSDQAFTFTESFLEITYGSNEFQITGVTATQNNILHISVYTGAIRQASVQGYRLNVGFRIDSTDIHCAEYLYTGTYLEQPGNWEMNYVVPASFTNKTIQARGSEQTSSVGVSSAVCKVGNMPFSSYSVGMNIFEIQV